jgi:uncharacterized membrane protein YbhN (UPF0104 family)
VLSDFSALLRDVISRERLQGLASRVAELATTRRVRITSQLLLFAALLFVLLRLRSFWRDSHASLDRVSWPPFVGAGALAVVAVVAAAFVWLAILRLLGVFPRRRWAAIFLQAQLGKYIPGSVWQYAGRAVLARGEAVPFRLVAVSVTVELAAAGLAGAVFASLVAGLWSFVAVAAVAASAALLAWWTPFRQPRPGGLVQRRFSPPVVRALKATTGGALLYSLIWAALGIGFWLTARALFTVPLHDVGYYAGSFAIASLAGLIAFFAPVGLGVREAVLVALLRPRLGTADALLLAAVSRGMLTIVDVGTAAAGALVLRRPSTSRTTEPPEGMRRSVAPLSEHHESDPAARI